MSMQINSRIPLIFGVPDDSFYETLEAKKVFVAELRPALEGMKVVAGSLLKKKVTPVVICDNMLGFCMKQGLVEKVFIFTHAVSRDTVLCRTGSLIAALAAQAHGIPVYLYKAKNAVLKKATLAKIGNKKVTTASIKTYAPVYEEVPKTLIKG